MKHEQAKEHAENGFLEKLGREPNRGETLALLAVAWLESQYGQGWKGVGKGSNNMGAIQAGSWKGETFEYVDTHPNADGTSTPYRVGFRKYPTPAEGFADLARVMYIGKPGSRWDREKVLDAAAREDWLGVSREMYRTGYYEGFGPTPEIRQMNHQKAFSSALKRIARALGIDVVLTLLRGSSGQAVEELQEFLAVTEAIPQEWKDAQSRVIKADGLFGPETERWLIRYQEAKADAIAIGDYLAGIYDHATAVAMNDEIFGKGEAPTDPPPPEGCPV